MWSVFVCNEYTNRRALSLKTHFSKKNIDMFFQGLKSCTVMYSCFNGIQYGIQEQKYGRLFKKKHFISSFADNVCIMCKIAGLEHQKNKKGCVCDMGMPLCMCVWRYADYFMCRIDRKWAPPKDCKNNEKI